MKILFHFLIFILISNKLIAFEIRCKFEEVYMDSSVQNGILLIKDDELRYQYIDENLFTLFQKNNEFFLVKNNDPTIARKVNENLDLILKLNTFFKDYPNHNNSYKEKDLEIALEESSSFNFFKRISIKSEKTSLSIYFNQCEETFINKTLFNINPFVEYSY